MIKGVKTIIINQSTDLKFTCQICLKEKELGKNTKGQITFTLVEGSKIKKESVCYNCALKLADYVSKGYIDYLANFKSLNKFCLVALSKEQVCSYCSKRKIEFINFEYYLKDKSFKQVKKICSDCFLQKYLEFKNLIGVYK